MILPVIFLRHYAEIRAKFGENSSQARKAADLISGCGRSGTEADARVYLESIRANGQIWFEL